MRRNISTFLRLSTVFVALSLILPSGVFALSPPGPQKKIVGEGQRYMQEQKAAKQQASAGSKRKVLKSPPMVFRRVGDPTRPMGPSGGPPGGAHYR